MPPLPPEGRFLSWDQSVLFSALFPFCSIVVASAGIGTITDAVNAEAIVFPVGTHFEQKLLARKYARMLSPYGRYFVDLKENTGEFIDAMKIIMKNGNIQRKLKRKIRKRKLTKEQESIKNAIEWALKT